jgi:carotenoid 1,2-hydratase
MKIISDYFRDIKHTKKEPGSYEWWYFDALTDEGYGVVVIFYDGNPFSRRYIDALGTGQDARASNYPAISISVYEGHKPVYYSFTEAEPHQAEFSGEEPRGRVNDCTFQSEILPEGIRYTLLLDQKLPNGDSILGELRFTSPSVPIFKSGEDADLRETGTAHLWNLIQPRAEVDGNIEIAGFEKHHISIRGAGYHDHNLGGEPMKESFREWYWGRYHFADKTLIYYLMDQNGKPDYKAWMIGDDGSIEEALEVSLKELGASLFGLKTSRKIEVNFHSSDVLIQKDTVLDSGPFYQRFRGRALLHADGGLMEALGISEYIYPSRIYSKIFWPLVNMRISYPGKAHWVQKSPRLYRWTW